MLRLLNLVVVVHLCRIVAIAVGIQDIKRTTFGPVGFWTIKARSSAYVDRWRAFLYPRQAAELFSLRRCENPSYACWERSIYVSTEKHPRPSEPEPRVRMLIEGHSFTHNSIASSNFQEQTASRAQDSRDHSGSIIVNIRLGIRQSSALVPT